MSYNIPEINFSVTDFDSVKSQAQDIIQNGIAPGEHIGFNSTLNKLSFKKGYSTIIFGPPHSGKSQLVKEIIIDLAERKGLKFLLLVPEWGREVDAFVSLLQTYLKRRLFGSDREPIDIYAVDKGVDFVKKHFLLVPAKKQKPTIPVLFDISDYLNARKKGEFKPDMIVADHWKWLSRPDEWAKLQTDDYVQASMQEIVTRCEDSDVHFILLNHTSNIDLITDKDTGKRYQPKATAFDMTSGQNFFRLGQQILSVYRPLEGIEDKNTGMLHRKNEMIVSVEKSWPQGIGEFGAAIKLFFDRDKQRFYEEINEDRFYAGEFEACDGKRPDTTDSAMSNHFDDEDSPF